jgi:hypothetical protein
MIPVLWKGNTCYIVDAELIKEEKATYKVMFQGKPYRWQKSHSEFISPGRFAIRTTFYDVLFNQDKTKKIIRGKIELQRNPIRRISKN